MSTKITILIFILLTATDFLFSQNTAIENYTKQLNTAETEEKPGIYYLIANEYLSIDIEKSLTYALEGEKLIKKINDNLVAANIYEILGDIYSQKNNLKEAVKYFEKELECRIILGNDGDLAICYYNIASTYLNNSNEKKAITAFENSLKYAKLAGNKEFALEIYETLFNLYLENKNYEDAFKYFKLWMAIKDSTFKVLKNEELVILRKQKDEKEEELKVVSSNINSLSSTLENVNYTLNVVDKELMEVTKEKYELDSLTKEQQTSIDLLKTQDSLSKEQLKTKDLELKTKDLELKTKDLKLNILILAIVSLSVLSLIILFLFLYKRKMNNKLKYQNNVILQQNEEIKAQNEEIRVQNEEIEFQKDEVEKQRDEINKKNIKITDSLIYAEKIQFTIMPPVEILNTYFPENFIFFKPRDIVSGDFYWFSKISFGKRGNIYVNENIESENELFIFTAADCTGHGVPGAFMSMLGISFLNEIVYVNRIYEANEILNTLREKIIKALRQTEKNLEAKDGIDMSLCVFDKNKMLLQYAGANSPLIIFRKNIETQTFELKEYEFDFMPVGFQSENDLPFKNNIINILPKDTCYIFSDGYFDQFGGQNNKKFLQNNFNHLVYDIQDKTMKEQLEIIKQTFYDWKGNNPQIDDVLVMGIKF